MPRTPRKLSEAGLYHVFARGVGRLALFEDADDSSRFPDMLGGFVGEAERSLPAWRLTGNHLHLLARARMPEPSRFMKRLRVACALYYNARYDRPGRLFRGRFGGDWRAALPSAGIARRDEVLGEPKSHGATVRQISRITGIGRGIVQKAKTRQE